MLFHFLQLFSVDAVPAANNPMPQSSIYNFALSVVSVLLATPPQCPV
jgi:hypothetical protein